MSYSSDIREKMAESVPKKQCCCRAAADGIWASDADSCAVRFTETGGIEAFIRSVTVTGYGRERVSIRSGGNRIVTVSSDFSFRRTGRPDFRCPSCSSYYLKGAFIAHGRISGPEGPCFLEFSFDTAAEAERFAVAAETVIPGASVYFRRGKYVVYYKKSEAVEDFLAITGSTSNAFEIMNARIEKQLRNDANRYSNCSSANLRKAVSSSRRHVEAIRLLYDTGKMSLLPPELIEAAKLRMEYPELTLSELSKLAYPPVSKSGMNHRLNRVCEYADDIRKMQEEN